MAETPKFYMPDFKVTWQLQGGTAWKTEQVEYRSGRRQRRGQWGNNRRRWKLTNAFNMVQADRRAMYKFFNDRKGMLESFFFWEPSPREFYDFGTGQQLGTSGASDTWHAVSPLKGAYWLGDSPVLTGQATKSGVLYATNGANRQLTQLAGYGAMPMLFQRYCGFRFNGLNQYASAGVAANTRIAGSQTWSAWVFLLPADSNTLWNICGNGLNNASGCNFWIDAVRKLNFQTNQAGANTLATSAAAIPLGAWTLVTMVRTGTSVQFFINGVASGSAISSITNPVTATSNFYIGTDPNSVGGANKQYHGMMADVRVHAATLSSASVLEMFNRNQIYEATNVDSLVAKWRMEDGDGAVTFADSGPSNYTATLTNPSDDSWVGGEEELQQGSAAASAGLLFLPNPTAARQRIVTTFNMDEIPETFMSDAVDVRAQFQIELLEAVN